MPHPRKPPERLDSGDAAPPPVQSSGVGKGVLLLFLMVLLSGAWFLFPLDQWIRQFVGWSSGAGFQGALLFGVVYVVATVLVMPGSIITLGAGFIYGPLVGLAIASPASVLGAACSFGIARVFLRGWAERKLQSSRKLRALDGAIGARGFTVVLGLRLSPVVPFSLLNYALGATRISLGRYLLASALGMLPGTFLYVYLGSVIPHLANLSSGAAAGAGTQIYYWAGLAVTLGLSVWLTRIGRRAIQDAADSHRSPSEGDPDSQKEKSRP